MKQLKIAVVGCGGIAEFAHIPAYKTMENVKIVGLCDIKLEKAKRLAASFDYEIPVYEKYSEMIEKSGADAIDICTPNYLHSIVAVEALQAGKHVFCEKPDAVDVAEAEKMKAAAEKAGRILMVMRNNRFVAPSKVLKEFVAKGNAGEIYCGRCGWVRRRGIPGKGGWFTTKAQSGGGPLIDLGVHMIDLAIWLMGNPTPVAVSGATYTKFAQNDAGSDSVNSIFGEAVKDGVFDVEDLAMGMIRFDNGACLQIEFSWASNVKEETNFVELRGTKAGIQWRNGAAEIYGEMGDMLTNQQLLGGSSINGHQGNLMHFVDVVLNGAQPDFVPQQGINMIKILRAIYTSAETKKEVLL